MKFLKMSVLYRAEAYFGMVAVVALVAAMAAMLKTGPLVALHEVLEYVAHAMAYFASEVASAEVVAAMLFRLFGEAE